MVIPGVVLPILLNTLGSQIYLCMLVVRPGDDVGMWAFSDEGSLVYGEQRTSMDLHKTQEVKAITEVDNGSSANGVAADSGFQIDISNDRLICNEFDMCANGQVVDERCVFCTGNTKICPDDSFMLPLEYPRCCNSSDLPPSCKCKACPEVHCASNESLTVMSTGSGLPGSCCNTYKCLQGPDTCSYNKVSYNDGDEWYPDKCSVCHCEKGLVYCSRRTCEAGTGCGYMYTPNDECCPVCGGCMSNSRLFMLNQSWSEADGCFKCKCMSGRAKCTAEYCIAPVCKHPRKVDNVCCPVCDKNDTYVDVIEAPSRCASSNQMLIAHCTLVCEFGLAVDENGCLQCTCSSPICINDCPYGQAFLSESRRQCICAGRNCKQIYCDKICVHGFEQLDGCLICKCRPCIKLECNQTCIYGNEVDTNGCETCWCLKDSSERYKDSTAIASITKLKPCTDGDRLVGHMEIYFDGCRQCICVNGIFMCALLSCPTANVCPKMKLDKDHCCPSCTQGQSISAMSSTVSDLLNKLCIGSNGKPLPNGELLVLDECTRCQCFMGTTFCEVAHCEQTRCIFLPTTPAFPMQVKGSCCATCPNWMVSDLDQMSTALDAAAGKPCNENELQHPSGAVWISQACQTCQCRNGVVYCFPHECPQLSCSVAVHKKGTCCPFCLERALMTVCIFNDQVYRNGDVWQVSTCSSCLCNRGQIVCTRTPCPPLRCKLPVLLSGHCCAVCADVPPDQSNLIDDNQEIRYVGQSLILKDQAQFNAVPINNPIIYSGLLVAIVCLIAIVVALLLIIVWRTHTLYRFHDHAERCKRRNGQKGGFLPFKQMGCVCRCNRKERPGDINDVNALSSLCASIQFDNSTIIHSVGDLLALNSVGSPVTCSQLSLASNKLLFDFHGKLVKYEIVGADRTMHTGSGALTIASDKPNSGSVEYCTMTLPNNSTSLLILTSTPHLPCAVDNNPTLDARQRSLTAQCKDKGRKARARYRSSDQLVQHARCAIIRCSDCKEREVGEDERLPDLLWRDSNSYLQSYECPSRVSTADNGQNNRAMRSTLLIKEEQEDKEDEEADGRADEEKPSSIMYV